MYFVASIQLDNSGPVNRIIRIDDDGTVWWLGLGEHDPDYLAWVAEGNTPEPWENTNGPQ